MTKLKACIRGSGSVNTGFFSTITSSCLMTNTGPRVYDNGKKTERMVPMRSTLWRVLWVISGVLLMAAGVTAILNPSVALTSLALLIGISMLISGIIDIVIFAETYKLFTGSGWILADGILIGHPVPHPPVQSLDNGCPHSLRVRYVGALHRHRQAHQLLGYEAAGNPRLGLVHRPGRPAHRLWRNLLLQAGGGRRSGRYPHRHRLDSRRGRRDPQGPVQPPLFFLKWPQAMHNRRFPASY